MLHYSYLVLETLSAHFTLEGFFLAVNGHMLDNSFPELKAFNAHVTLEGFIHIVDG